MSHLDLAKDAIRKGDVLTASIEATKAIEEHPEEFEAYVLRSQISLAFGDKKGAAEDMKRAAELNPSLLDNLNGKFQSEAKEHC